MIILRTTKSYVHTAHQHFFPYIRLLKQTKLNNLAHCSILSEERMTVLAINCLLSELELLLNKKIVNTSGVNIKIKFSDAQAIVLYKTLLALPLPAEQFFLNKVRNEWIQILDQQLIANNIYEQAKAAAPALSTGGNTDFNEFDYQD